MTELLAACSYNGIANGVGSYSFTNALIKELLELRHRSSFSTGDLYRNLFLHAQYHSEHGRDRPAPVHLPLTKQLDFPRSIQLSALQRPKYDANKIEVGNHLAEHSSHSVSTLDCSDPGCKSDSISRDESAKPSCELLAKDLTPRILFAVRLKESFLPDELSIDKLTEWVRTIPLLGVEEVNIEGGFKSFSSVIIISVPIAMQAYIPSHPAVFCLGPITSNIMHSQDDNPLIAPIIPSSLPIEPIDRPSLSGRECVRSGMGCHEAQKQAEATSDSFATPEASQHRAALKLRSQPETSEITDVPLINPAADIPEVHGYKRIQHSDTSTADDALGPTPSDGLQLTTVDSPFATQVGGSDQRRLMAVPSGYEGSSIQHGADLIERGYGGTSTGKLLSLVPADPGRVRSGAIIQLLDSGSWDLETQCLRAERNSYTRERGSLWTQLVSVDVA